MWTCVPPLFEFEKIAVADGLERERMTGPDLLEHQPLALVTVNGLAFGEGEDFLHGPETVEHGAFLLDHRNMRDFVSPAQFAAFLRQKKTAIFDIPDPEDMPLAFAVEIAVPVAAGTDELALKRQLAADVRQFGGQLILPGDLPETVGVGVLQILVPGAHAEWGVRFCHVRLLFSP